MQECSKSFSLAIHEPRDAFKKAVSWRAKKELEIYGINSHEIDELSIEKIFNEFMDSYLDKYPDIVNL